MAGHRLQRRPSPNLTVQVRQKRGQDILATRQRRIAKQNPIELRQYVRVVVGVSAQHHAIDVFELFQNLLLAREATINYHF